MNTQVLIQEAAQQGVGLSVNGEMLRCHHPNGPLPLELAERLRQHKPALLAYLRQQGQEATPPVEELSATNAPRAPAPCHDRIAYLEAFATEDELALIDPPAALSIEELFHRVKARMEAPAHQEERIKAFFGTWPSYLGAIRWRLSEGWSEAAILAYVGEYQPEMTLKHLESAASDQGSSVPKS